MGLNGNYNSSRQGVPRFFTLEIVMIIVAMLAGFVLAWAIAQPEMNRYVSVMVISGLVFSAAIATVMFAIMDPDSIRASQSSAMLNLTSKTLEAMNDGLTPEAAQKICKLLRPATLAVAVSITDKSKLLGYAGYHETEVHPGDDIRTLATHATLADGVPRILLAQDEIGLPEALPNIKAAIVVPLVVGRRVEGTLKFYFRRKSQISDTQRSIAVGFGRVISAQMAVAALEEQTQLATKMELMALQNQINPHFLFNTLNTIASFIRTDAPKARVLLREFAVFYRRTLEESGNLIMLSREVEQTCRYFMFEQARFGEDRVAIEVDMEPEAERVMIPPLLVQPLVENAVKHALPPEGKLTVTLLGRVQGNDLIVQVIDDGKGMSTEQRLNIMHPESSSGCGIAVGNVHDRIKGYFGIDSHMDVESELGKGTTVTLALIGAAVNNDQAIHPEEPLRHEAGSTK